MKNNILIKCKRFGTIIISKLENYLGFNIRYFIGGGSYLLASHFVSIVFRLFLTIVLARFLTKQIYGQYNFVISIIGILTIFTLPGMGSAIIRAVARGYDGTYIRAVKTKIKYSLIGISILAIVIIYFILRDDLHLAGYLLIASIFFIPQYCLVEHINFFTGKKDFRRVSLFSIITTVIYATLAIIVTYFTRNLSLIILTTTGSIALSYFIFFLISLKYRKNNKTKKSLIRYGKHLTVIEAIPTIGIYLDKLIIAYFIGFEVLAIYSIAMIIPHQMRDIVKSIAPVFSPKFSELKQNEVYPKIKKRLIYLTIIPIIFGIIMIVLAPHIIPLLWGQKYINSVYYTQILIVAITAILPTIILINLLKVQKKKKEILKINIFMTLSSIILMLILIPKFMLLGAVWSVLISRVLGSIYIYYQTIKTFTS